MQVPITKLIPTTVTAEITEDDIIELRKIINKEFLFYITHATFDGYITPNDKATVEFAARFGVDGSSKVDRVAFFQSLLSALQ
jgi:hypothetical protein